jgi:hypothetical protein
MSPRCAARMEASGLGVVAVIMGCGTQILRIGCKPLLGFATFCSAFPLIFFRLSILYIPLKKIYTVRCMSIHIYIFFFLKSTLSLSVPRTFVRLIGFQLRLYENACKRTGGFPSNQSHGNSGWSAKALLDVAVTCMSWLICILFFSCCPKISV